MRKYYAIVRWMVDDIKTRRPNWSKDKCLQWLEENEDVIQEVGIVAGNEFIDDNLPEDEASI